jgi:hypothetical protein
MLVVNGCPMSALPPKEVIDRGLSQVRFVPQAKSCTEKTAFLFNHFVGDGERPYRYLDVDRSPTHHGFFVFPANWATCYLLSNSQAHLGKVGFT